MLYIPRLDKTILTLVALMLAAGGALTVLTNVTIPQVNQTFLGNNPFAIKQAAIESTMGLIFSMVALLGVVVQAVTLVVAFPERLHRWPTYARVAAASASMVLVLLWLMASAGFAIARRSWLPEAIEGQRDLFRMTEMLVRNDGLEDTMLIIPAGDPQLAEARQQGRERLRGYIEQLEQLFDLSDTSGTLDHRLSRILPLFAPRAP